MSEAELPKTPETEGGEGEDEEPEFHTLDGGPHGNPPPPPTRRSVPK